MIDLRAIERAGRVRRWHSNPDMVHTDDPVSHHAGRVARIICALWPDASAALISAALIHDDGESGAWGDVSATAKAAMSQAAHDELAKAEGKARCAVWGGYGLLVRTPFITDVDYQRLKLADRLDAYMWVQRHRPDILDRDGWPEDRKWLAANAAALGVSDQVCAVLEEVA